MLGALASLLAAALTALWLQRREPWHARLRRNTRAMRDSDARFQDLCEQAALGVVQVDSISLQVMSVNQRYCSLTGYAADELLQRSVLDLCMPQERGDFARLLKALIAGEMRDIRGEHALECKDGSQAWVEVNISLIGLQQPRQILAWVQDISERKRLQQLEQQGHRQLRRIMQRLPVGLVMEAHDGRLVYWNEDLLRL
ncbi:MAG: PAS domain S-box protein, partial [Comamonas sp.]